MYVLQLLFVCQTANGDWISLPPKVYTKGYNSIPININNLQVKILFNPHIDIKIASYHLFCMYDISYSIIVLGLKNVIHGSPWTISN